MKYGEDTPPRTPVDELTDPETITIAGCGPSLVGKVRIANSSLGPKVKVTSSWIQGLEGVSVGGTGVGVGGTGVDVGTDVGAGPHPASMSSTMHVKSASLFMLSFLGSRLVE